MNPVPSPPTPSPVVETLPEMAVNINDAHGQRIETKYVIDGIKDHVLNQQAVAIGQAQGAVVKAYRSAMDRIGKQVGRAQAAVDGTIQDLSTSAHGTIESAIAPLVELGIELPGPSEIALAKQSLSVNKLSQLPTTGLVPAVASAVSATQPNLSGAPVPESGPVMGSPYSTGQVFCPVGTPGGHPIAEPTGPWACSTGNQQFGGIENVPVPQGILQPIQQPPQPQPIDNIQCPPVAPCPPCPLPPANPCTFAVWVRYCQVDGFSSCYLIPGNGPPIDPRDSFVGTIDDPQGLPVCQAWQQCEDGTQGKLPICAVPPGAKPGQPGGILQPIFPPTAPPGCCPPPQTIINAPPGGTIINQQPPSGILQPNFPPSQQPPTGGTIINILPPPAQPSQEPQQPPQSFSSFPVGGLIDNKPALCDLVSLAWGSPRWCECALTWFTALTDLGRDARWLLTSNSTSEVVPSDSVFWLMHALIPTMKACTIITNADQFAAWWDNTRQRVAANLDVMYGMVSLAIYGASFLRAAIISVSEAVVSSHLVSGAGCGIDFGLAKLGIGIGEHNDRSIEDTFEASIRYDLRQAVVMIDQLIAYFAPIEPISVAHSTSMYITGQLSLSEYRCAVNAAGLHPDWADKIGLAGRSQPTPYDYISYWRRGKMTDEDLAVSMRGIGYLVTGEIDVLKEVTTIIPPPTDLVRFMLRAIGDPAIVQRFQLEAEFDLLYVGVIKEWAKAIGISEEVLRKYHAAHWDIPGPGDLATFWQRFGENRTSDAANALPNKMTSQDYDRALREQGIAPFWRPFYIAAQYQIPGRRDLQWAYQFGALDEQHLKDGFLDLGYRPEQLDMYVRVTRQRSIKQWLSDPIIKAYAKNGINEQGMTSYMSDVGVPEELRREIIDRVKIEAVESANEAVVKLLEQAYATGQLNDEQLLAALLEIGLDPDQVNRIVVARKAEKQARPKEIPAQQLCQMYGARLISRQEFFDRLVTLRYTPDDAELIILKCESDLSLRQLKQEQLALKQQAAADRRRIKDLNYAERQAQLAKDRAAKALAAQLKSQRQALLALAKDEARATAQSERTAAREARAVEVAEREELRTLALMEHLVDSWSKWVGGEAAALMAELSAVLISATADGVVNLTELLGAALQLVEKNPANRQGTLADLVTEARRQVAAGRAITGEQSTNGNPLASSTGQG